MRNLSKLSFVGCLLVICNCFGQSITWQRTYNPFEDGHDEGRDLCPADSSNFYIVGYTASPIRKSYVLKLNSYYGDTLWTRIFDNGDIAHGVTSTGDGGCIFTGDNAFACRIKPDGDTLWLKYYNGVDFYDIIRTIEGNYILCGTGYSSGYKGLLCKIDSSGNIIWQNLYSLGNSLDFFRIETALNGGYIISGITNSGSSIAYVAKINDTGAIQWQKIYTIWGYSYISGIASTISSYIFTGLTGDNVFVLKTNSNGDSLLTNVFWETSNIYDGPSLLKTNNNKFYVSHINGPYVSKIFSIDSNLNVIKSLTLQHPNPQSSIWLFSLMKAPNSNKDEIICAGGTDLNEIYNYDVYAARLDSALNPPPPISVSKFSHSIPEKFKLHQNYPNPFNGNTIIEFEIPSREIVIIKIYDVLGRELKTIVNEILGPGLYRVNFSPVDLSSGVYMYAIMTESYKETRKLIFVK